jgi:hypothetical protein
MTKAPTKPIDDFFGLDVLEPRRLNGCKVTITEAKCEMRPPSPNAEPKDDHPSAALSIVPVVDGIQRPRTYFKIDSSGEKIGVSEDGKRFIRLDLEHRVHALTAYGCFIRNLRDIAKVPPEIYRAGKSGGENPVWGDHDWLNGLVITFEEFAPWKGLKNEKGEPIVLDLPSQFHAAETAENRGGAVAGVAEATEIDEDLLKIDLSAVIAEAVAKNGAAGLPRKALYVLISQQTKRGTDQWSKSMQSRAMSYVRPEAAEAFAEVLEINGLIEKDGNIIQEEVTPAAK